MTSTSVFDVLGVLVQRCDRTLVKKAGDGRDAEETALLRDRPGKGIALATVVIADLLTCRVRDDDRRGGDLQRVPSDLLDCSG